MTKNFLSSSALILVHSLVFAKLCEVAIHPIKMQRSLLQFQIWLKNLHFVKCLDSLCTAMHIWASKINFNPIMLLEISTFPIDSENLIFYNFTVRESLFLTRLYFGTVIQIVSWYFYQSSVTITIFGIRLH